MNHHTHDDEDGMTSEIDNVPTGRRFWRKAAIVLVALALLYGAWLAVSQKDNTKRYLSDIAIPDGFTYASSFESDASIALFVGGIVQAGDIYTTTMSYEEACAALEALYGSKTPNGDCGWRWGLENEYRAGARIALDGDQVTLRVNATFDASSRVRP